MGGTIFISYRRDQDAGFAGRLFDRLERTFRRKALFMDVDSISPGQDFPSIVEARVAECDALLALIGRGWLTATDEAGRRRLDNAKDFVRREIAAALTQAKPVIPVLIDDVPMPRAEDLPEELKPLVRPMPYPQSRALQSGFRSADPGAKASPGSPPHPNHSPTRAGEGGKA